MPGPLAGIRVIDLATERGELTGRILADLGAEVIKVEPPEGAPARRLPPFEQGREGDVEASLYWAAVALGKRSVVLDLHDPGDRERLLALVTTADVLVESFEPGAMDTLRLGYEDVQRYNPGIIYVSVSPFGQDGPEAHSPAAPLTIEAAGGLVGLQGDHDRPPVPIGHPQAWYHAAAQAAADTIIALNERHRSSLGQRLDTAAQPAIVWTLMNATGFPPNTGSDPPRTGEKRTDPPVELVPGIALKNLWECKDGWMQGSPGLGARGARTVQSFMDWAEAEGALPEELRGRDWRNWPLDVQEGRLPLPVAHAMVAALEAFIKSKTKRELLDAAVRFDMLFAPVYSMDEVVADRQLNARDYWQQVGGRTHPGPFARLSRTPVQLGAPAPALGADQNLLEGLPAPRPAPARPAPRRELAFTGLKVADFAWVGVGPIIGKALSDNGATVVHVESAVRPDVLRMGPPFKDGQAGIDRSQFMANFNSSKLGLALNLTKEEGRAIARRLIDWADVMIESFTPGTIGRFGFDYATLSKDRPELIMLSTCLRGQTGPEATFAGFGQQGASLAGFHGITGWPDRPPAGPWGAYTDFIAPRYGVAALTSAIFHRARTGEGQYIDLSQVEAGIHFLEPLVLDYTVNGRVAERAGHASAYACPHGVYQTAGVERYVAIAVETAAQWQALRSIAPLDEFADPALAALSARIARRDAIEQALHCWTRDNDPWELAQTLKAAGVPASVVLRPSDLYHDAQLAHRGFFVTLDHHEMGPTPYDGAATRFSAVQGEPRFAAPCLGEHTQQVLREFLGLSEEEITQLAAAGVLS